MEACKTQREEITRLLESLNGELRALLKYLPKDGTDPQELEARLLAAKSREKDAEDKTAALQQALAQAAQNVQLAQAKLMDAQKLLERTQIEYNTFLGEHKGTDPERLSAYSSALAHARQEQRDSLEKRGGCSKACPPCGKALPIFKNPTKRQKRYSKASVRRSACLNSYPAQTRAKHRLRCSCSV